MGFKTWEEAVSTQTDIKSKAKSRQTYSKIDNVLLVIDSILAHPEPRTLNNGQHTRLLPRRSPALKLPRALQLSLHAENGLPDPRTADGAGRRRREPACTPLTNAIRGIDARGIGGFDEMLRDDVDGALAGLAQVLERVLCIVKAAGIANDEERRVMVDHLEPREGRQVGAASIGRARAHESDGPWHDR